VDFLDASTLPYPPHQRWLADPNNNNEFFHGRAARLPPLLDPARPLSICFLRLSQQAPVAAAESPTASCSPARPGQRLEAPTLCLQA
jgi:hypothetical protein